MYECGRVEHRVASSVTQPSSCQPVQLAIRGRKQRIARRSVARLNPCYQRSELIHSSIRCLRTSTGPILATLTHPHGLCRRTTCRGRVSIDALAPIQATPCFVRGMKAQSEPKVVIGNARVGKFPRPMSRLIHGPCLFG